MVYRELEGHELKPSLFEDFQRRQQVTQCWRKIDGQWQIRDIAFVDDWNQTDYQELLKELRKTLTAGGVIFSAWAGDKMKGFASIEGRPLGSRANYMDLSNLYVSREMRGQGVGRALFRLAEEWARSHGAEKLYISAHSAVESQAFYRAVGCVEAVEYNPAHVAKEPCDCQMERVL